MEIISYIIDGALAHKHTLGNVLVIGDGEVQRHDRRHRHPPQRVQSFRRRAGALTIHQDVDLWASLLALGKTVAHDLAPGRGAWVQLIAGAIDINGTALAAGDGAALTDETALSITATADAHFLLFDLA